MGISIAEKAYAKINLDLYITGVREDGYHLLHTVMQTIDVYDFVEVSKTKKDISLEIRGMDNVPRDDKNSAYKAAVEMKKYFGFDGGYGIKIDKNIPVGAGLGGPSADAAAVIRAIAKLEGIELSQKESIDVGVSVGADVPFLVLGGLALCKGIGEELTQINSKLCGNILLAKPKDSVSSMWAYKEFDKIASISDNPNMQMIEALENNDLEGVCDALYNDLEIPVLKELPIILELKNRMVECGAISSLMSGSGSTVFGLFENESKLIECQNEMKKYFNEIDFISTIAVDRYGEIHK